MSATRRQFIGAALAAGLVPPSALARHARGASSGATPLSNPLIENASAFTYLGGFTLPSSFNYGGWALALGPVQGSPPSGSTNKTLFATNIVTESYSGLGAFYVPEDANLSNDCTYTASTYIAPPASGATSITSTIEADSTQTATNGLRISGCYYDSANNRVIGGYYWYYPNSYSDGAQRATFNAFTLDPTLDLSSLVIDQQIGTSEVDGSLLDGSQYAAAWGPVAPEWQSYLGGTTLASIGTLAILEDRSGYGPVLNVFTPGNLSSGTALPTTCLACYGNTGTSYPAQAVDSFDATQTWGYGDTGGQAAFNAIETNAYWSVSGAESIACAFAPAGYRTIVIAGTHCAGPYVYGDPTATESLAGTVETTATFTATVTAGSSILTNVTVQSGTISVGNCVCTVDGNGFFTVFPGFKPATKSDQESSIRTAITAYDTGAGTLTLSNADPTDSGSFTFVANTGEPLAYDPTLYGGKGTFAYPYEFYVWLYDILDALQVKAGTMEPYQIQPYFVGQLPWPPNIATGDAARRMQGHAAFDPDPGDGSAGRLYMQITKTGTVQIGVWQLAIPS